MRRTKDIDKHLFTVFLDQNVSEMITLTEKIGICLFICYRVFL